MIELLSRFDGVLCLFLSVLIKVATLPRSRIGNSTCKYYETTNIILFDCVHLLARMQRGVEAGCAG